MAARQDKNVILLTLIANEIARRGVEGLLPNDLQGDAIVTQIREHEAALQGRQTASNTVSGERTKALAAFATTANVLTRLRYALLAAYSVPGDTRIAAFGPLGTAAKPHDNLVRLVALIPKVTAAVEAGELMLPAELQPTVLSAQAELHAALSTSTAGKVASRQVGAETLAAERRQTRVLIRRLKGFVTAHFGDGELSSFGFNLPLPPRRPRLPDEPAEAATAEPATARAA